jgi:hypothetical protein
MTDMQVEAKNKESIEELLATRKEAGLTIDPETAEVSWHYAQVLDPYGIYPNLPDEACCVGRSYFARAPSSDVWVSFYDLPDATRDALWQTRNQRLVFPTGLCVDDDELPF